MKTELEEIKQLLTLAIKEDRKLLNNSDKRADRVNHIVEVLVDIMDKNGKSVCEQRLSNLLEESIKSSQRWYDECQMVRKEKDRVVTECEKLIHEKELVIAKYDELFKEYVKVCTQLGQQPLNNITVNQ